MGKEVLVRDDIADMLWRSNGRSDIYCHQSEVNKQEQQQPKLTYGFSLH